MLGNIRKANNEEVLIIAQFLFEQEKQGKFIIDYECFMAEVGEVYGEYTTEEQKFGCAVALLGDCYISVIEDYQGKAHSYNGIIFTITWHKAGIITRLGIKDGKVVNLCDNVLNFL